MKNNDLLMTMRMKTKYEEKLRQHYTNTQISTISTVVPSLNNSEAKKRDETKKEQRESILQLAFCTAIL